jgi:hypothetical protein
MLSIRMYLSTLVSFYRFRGGRWGVKKLPRGFRTFGLGGIQGCESLGSKINRTLERDRGREGRKDFMFTTVESLHSSVTGGVLSS